MKKSLFGIITFLTLSVLFNSCQIEKRLYRDGYHISWNRSMFSKKIAPVKKTNQTAIAIEEITENQKTTPSEAEPNVPSVATISASSNESTELILPTKKSSFILSKNDTIVPDQQKQQEEYFSNNYVSPEQPQDIRDQQLANWALGLGIASVSTPVWATILFLGIGAAAGFSWVLLGVSVLIGVALFLALEITAIAFAIRFLRRHGTDPEYRKYRSRAITGLILAGIYPALMVINIILAILLAI